MVSSLVVSLFLKPLYLSTAILFPAATNNVSFSEQRNVEFGGEDRAEQLIEILRSSRIKDRIIDKYNLQEHYEIDDDESNKKFKLNKEYYEHFDFKRTKFGSIQIDVLDEDPELAAEMANDIVDLLDTVKNEMIRERTSLAFEIVKRKKNQLEENKNLILAKIDSLSQLGVVCTGIRSNLAMALVDSKDSKEKSSLKAQIETNLLLGAQFDALEQQRNWVIINIEAFQKNYEQAESDALAQFSHKFVVEKAVVADKKEKPNRIMIVFLATLGSFFLGVFYLLIVNKIRELKTLE